MKGHSLQIQKGFFKKNKIPSKANENSVCFKCGKKGHFAKECFSKTTSEPSFKFLGNNSFSGPSKFQPKLLQSSQRSEKSPQIDFEAKYRKAKAKLALLESSSTVTQLPQAPKRSRAKNKGLVAEIFDWDEVEVSSDDNEEVHIRKSHARNGEWVNITMRKVNILLSMDDDADWKSYSEEPQTF